MILWCFLSFCMIFEVKNTFRYVKCIFAETNGFFASLLCSRLLWQDNDKVDRFSRFDDRSYAAARLEALADGRAVRCYVGIGKFCRIFANFVKFQQHFPESGKFAEIFQKIQIYIRNFTKIWKTSANFCKLLQN